MAQRQRPGRGGAAAVVEDEDEAAVRAARETKDALEGLDAFRRVRRAQTGLDVVLAYRWTSEAGEEALEWAVALTRANMRAMYEACPGWGWDEAAKRAELRDPDGRYLVARDAASGRLAAFAHLRFLLEDGVRLCYLWELQVGDAFRRRRLGLALMQVVELVAWRAGMDKVVLTAFADNAPALRFYERLGYELDETDPSLDDDGEEDVGYRILSKANRRRLAKR